MQLTKEQKHSLKNGEAIAITVDDEECVLLSRSVYDRVRQLLYDDSEMTHEEMRVLLAKSYQGSGWDEPAMHVYDNYDEERKNRCL